MSKIDTGTQELLASKENGVGILTMNRPEARNAMSGEMNAAMQEMLAQFETDAEVRCVVLTGAGKGFCAGGDVKGMAASGDGTVGTNTIDSAIHRQRVHQRATSGKLFAAGQSGERFAVRNSGAEAVIEGCGSNGCEYMTGGTVIILGKVGDNFAAGMTGGMAFIYDPNQEFENYVNPNSVIWQLPETDYWKNYLQKLISEHYEATQSKIAYKILENYNDEVKNFKQVCPKEMIDRLLNRLSLKTKISKAV